MRIILAPAKKMKTAADEIVAMTTPVFLEEACEVLAWLRSRSYPELKKLWGCNDKIAEVNFDRLAEMEPRNEALLTPAVWAYEGIAYQYMAPAVFEDVHFQYVQEHLRILSGFYGVLKPLDGVMPYRLEMQAKARVGGTRNLYEFWGDKIYREVVDESRVIVDLASKEYSVCVERYLQPGDTYVVCVFGEFADAARTKVVQKGVYAKMARGEMVRYMAENDVREPEGMKGFDRLGFHFCEELSDEGTYVFIRE